MRRPSRRALGGAALALGGGGLLGLRLLNRRRGPDSAVRIDVRATPLPSFTRTPSDRRVFGELAWRGGLVLTTPASGFGGFSGLWRSPEDGRALVAVSDHGQWLMAEVEQDGGRPSGLASAWLAPILGPDGEPLRHGDAYDTESLAIADGSAFVGIERVHEVRRFDWAADGVAARGVALPLPPETRSLASNKGLEAVAVAPPGHPLAGAVVAIAEEVGGGAADPTRGWVVTGPKRFTFAVARSEDFDITDAAFLPSGELLLLERRFSPLRGVACRIRRVAADAIRPGAVLDGRVLLDVDDRFEIDNMEGLAVHRDASRSETVLTLVSDDNFSPLQRTLLLEFAMAG